MAEFYRAVETFHAARRDGVERLVRAGDLVSSDDPVFKGREGLFEPVADAVARWGKPRVHTSETATAAPGELRVRAPQPPPAKAKAAALFSNKEGK